MFLLQRLYEFVFAMGTTDVDQSFRISKAAPIEYVVCSNAVTLEAVDLSTPCTLIVENADGDVLDLFEDTHFDRDSDGMSIM